MQVDVLLSHHSSTGLPCFYILLPYALVEVQAAKGHPAQLDGLPDGSVYLDCESWLDSSDERNWIYQTPTYRHRMDNGCLLLEETDPVDPREYRPSRGRIAAGATVDRRMDDFTDEQLMILGQSSVNLTLLRVDLPTMWPADDPQWFRLLINPKKASAFPGQSTREKALSALLDNLAFSYELVGPAELFEQKKEIVDLICRSLPDRDAELKREIGMEVAELQSFFTSPKTDVKYWTVIVDGGRLKIDMAQSSGGVEVDEARVKFLEVSVLQGSKEEFRRTPVRLFNLLADAAQATPRLVISFSTRPRTWSLACATLLSLLIGLIALVK